jgi:hypothetical protein
MLILKAFLHEEPRNSHYRRLQSLHASHSYMRKWKSAFILAINYFRPQKRNRVDNEVI